MPTDRRSSVESPSPAARYKRTVGVTLLGRPLALVGVGLVALDSAIAAIGATFPALTALALLVAPGLALVPLLSARARDGWASAVAASPLLGFAASSVALISIASAGIRIDNTSVHMVLAVLVLAGLLAFRDGEPHGRPGRPELLAWLGLAGAVALGILLEARVIGGSPVPGNDWAKYTLYAEEIRSHGSLLINNPFWLLGVPFREDPGVPALYGSFLSVTGQPAAVLAHGIWAFAVAQVLGAYVFVRAFWGEIAGVLAAALWAVLPLNLTLLGWHGLANAAALALLLLVLLYATSLIVEGLRWPACLGFGLSLVALAAAHRLSFLVGAAAIAAALLIALATTKERRTLLRGIGGTALAAVVLCPGVAYDLVTRNKSFGGTQDYAAYLPSKAKLPLIASDLTFPFTAIAAVSVVLAVRWALKRDGALVPVLCALAVILLATWAWLVHVPLVYIRMAYFLPLALVPLVAIALTRVVRPQRLAMVAGAALVIAVAGLAWGQARSVHRLYAFTNTASLRGLHAVADRLRPREVVVTDRCWSFLTTWLLHTRTLAALNPTDIQPKAEVARARMARAILTGTPRGRALAKQLGVRYAVVDPTCRDDRGHRLKPPRVGQPAYISERLMVLRL